MKYFESSITVLKKLLSNKKIRFGVIVTMYIAILTLVTCITILNINKNKGKLDIYVEDYKEMNNYGYSYTIKSYDKNNKLTITSLSGKRHNDDNVVYYESKHYNLKTEKDELPITTVDFTKMDSIDIYNYLKIGSLTSQNNYLDVYHINLSKFSKLVDNKEINLDKDINITLVKMNKKIVQIELDLTNYVNLKEDIYNLYVITINYNQINEIVDF